MIRLVEETRHTDKTLGTNGRTNGMHREGHIGIGLLVYSPIAYLLLRLDLPELFGLSMVAMGFWSFAPDVDLHLPIRHRGPTHSIVAAVVAGGITALVAVYFVSKGTGRSSGIVIQSTILAFLSAAMYGFFIGILGVTTHLIGDVLTPMGIRPLWPFSDRYFGLNVVLAKNERANELLSFVGALL